MKVFGKKRLTSGHKIVLTLLFISLAILAFNNYANKSNNGSLINTGANSTPKAQQPNFSRVATPYYSTLLPSGWHEEESTSPNSPSRLSLVTFDSGTNEAQIAITTAPLPSGGLESVADYSLRKTQTSQYRVISSSLLPAGSTTFQNNNGINDTLFMYNPKFYASISVSGTSNSQILQLLTKVSRGWTWQ